MIGKSILSKQFMTLYIMFICSISMIYIFLTHLVIGFFIIGTYKKFSENLLHDNSYISMVGSIGAVFGGIRF